MTYTRPQRILLAAILSSSHFSSQRRFSRHKCMDRILGQMAGSTWTIVIDPVTPTTIYAGTIGGGVYKSVDGAETWFSVNIGLTDGSIFTLAIDPVTPTTLYAGTLNNGLFKTTNGGDSWRPVNIGLISRNIYAIAIDPLHPDILFASTASGIFKSTNGGESWIEICYDQSLKEKNYLTIELR